MRTSGMPALRRERFPYRQIVEIVPLELLELIRFEVAMLGVRVRSRRVDPRFRGAHGLLVNLGSGATGRPGWVNIDGFAAPGVTLLADVRRRIPLPDGSARIVFTEHLVEHLDYGRAMPSFLAECLRVLEPGGLLRVIVPSGERYLRAYVAGGMDAFSAFSPLARDYDFETRMEIVNAHFRQGTQHRFSYDFETLSRVLTRAGFEAVTERAFGDSQDPVAAIDREERATESLYVEAVEPGASFPVPA